MFAPTSKKRSSDVQDEDDETQSHQCCSDFSGGRPAKSGKTHDKQSVSPCTVHCQKYNQAADLIERGSIDEAVPILRSLLNDEDTDPTKNELTPSLHHVLIKASIKLATAYRNLSLPEEALITLDRVFLPKEPLYISYGHNLFGEASVIYSIVKDELRSKKKSTISSGAEFRHLYLGSCLSWMGHEFVKLQKYAPALIFFQDAVHEVERYIKPTVLFSYSLKQLYIQALLDLARCYLALGSLSNARLALNTLRSSERSLSITYINSKFPEMVNITTAIENWSSNSSNAIVYSLFHDTRGDYDGGLTHFPDCCYQTLCVPQGAPREVIQSSFRRLGRIIHPDKGGDTALMQRLLSAYGTLNNKDKRLGYDKTCKVMHSNSSNHIISQTE